MDTILDGDSVLLRDIRPLLQPGRRGAKVTLNDDGEPAVEFYNYTAAGPFGIEQVPDRPPKFTFHWRYDLHEDGPPGSVGLKVTPDRIEIIRFDTPTAADPMPDILASYAVQNLTPEKLLALANALMQCARYTLEQEHETP